VASLEQINIFTDIWIAWADVLNWL